MKQYSKPILNNDDYKIFKIRNTDAFIAYSKPVLAYELSFIITKSKEIATALKQQCKESNVAWFEKDLTDDEKINLDDRKARVYAEIDIIAKYIKSLEENDYAMIKNIANNIPISHDSYIMRQTKFDKNLNLVKPSFRRNFWVIEFSNKKIIRSIDTIIKE